MKTMVAPALQKISAVVSDVDGTLLTEQKSITSRTKAAVAALKSAGIAFSIISSRPPLGLRQIAGPLDIETFIGGYNGGLICRPDFSVVTGHVLPAETSQATIVALDHRGIDVWVFSGEHWYLRNPGGPYVAHEEHTVSFSPIVIDSFHAMLGRINKIVGVSPDFERLARCGRDMISEFSAQATIARSQAYYLDITPLPANKGSGVAEIARLLDVPLDQLAVIGDGNNDVAMFRTAGLSIAMGNAAPDVQCEAAAVTDSNDDDGFAKAIERFILR